MFGALAVRKCSTVIGYAGVIGYVGVIGYAGVIGSMVWL
jgi:hypothetical protein